MGKCEVSSCCAKLDGSTQLGCKGVLLHAGTAAVTVL